MFWAIVRWGNSPICWITYPMRRRSWSASTSVTSSPSKMIRPPVGSIMRLMSRRVVLFPHPDGPTRTRISPSLMSRSRSATAGVDVPA